ncbi:MAG: glucose-6-phosphate isomerase family protein [Patescibacteria group bacterium]
MLKSYASRNHEAMKEVLMSPNESGPEIHYYMIRGGDSKTNITIWESGTVGEEYIKTYGHYHVGDLEEDYTVLQGEGVIILQGQIVDDSIETFRAIKVKAHDKVHIPKNTGHLAINTGNVWFVTSDNSPVNFEEKDAVSLPGHADYSQFKRLRGAAYYVVKKDNEPTLVKNPLYKKVPEVKIENL